MLSLPSKPWKKVKIGALDEQSFRITIVTELENEGQFVEIIEEDIAASLGPHDRMGTLDWPSRSVVVTTSDLPAIKRNLIYSSIMVDVS